MGRKLTIEEFIEKARSVHGDKYDYSKVEYVDIFTKVKIICPKHGMFLQRPNNHLRGKGCPECGIESRVEKQTLNTEDFINKAKKVHGDKYDYTEVEYVNSNIKVNIKCSKHGVFSQRPADHLNGVGCPECGGTKKLSKKKIINKAKKVHGDKYDYSEVVYVNNRTKVNIICPKHGIFSQRPHDHLIGQGCPKCGKDSNIEKRTKWDKESCYNEAKKYEWVGDYQNNSRGSYKASLRNGWLKDYEWLKKKIKEGDNLGYVIYRYLIVDKYVYIGLSVNIDKRKRDRKSGRQKNDVVYKKCKELGVPIPEPTIIERCKNGIEAGEREKYWIKYYREKDVRYEVLNKHRGGSLGTPGYSSQRQSKEQFIIKARKVHGDKYDYSEVKYINSYTKVNIICPKHGIFSQRPISHLRGEGCKKCGNEVKAEKRTKWNKESCYKEAKKYEWLSDYIKNSASAYQISCKNGWLKDYDWLKKKK